MRSKRFSGTKSAMASSFSTFVGGDMDPKTTHSNQSKTWTDASSSSASIWPMPISTIHQSSSDRPVRKKSSKAASPKQSKTRKTPEKPKASKQKPQKRAQEEAKNKEKARAALLAREEKKEEKRAKLSEQKEKNAKARTTQAKAMAFELPEVVAEVEPEAPKKQRTKTQETTKKAKSQETTKKPKSQEPTKKAKAQETEEVENEGC